MESSGSSAGKSDSPHQDHPPLEEIQILGVLSDTHDKPDATAAGIATLRAAGAQFLLHCGDVGGQRILDLLAGIPCAFVWGNNDFDRTSLAEYAAHLGIQCCDDFAELSIGHKKIAVTHGDNPKLIHYATDPENKFDYLFVGHTHVPATHRINNTQVINPGALHRAANKTVAIIDLPKNTTRHLRVNPISK
jgi:hypothetical protein